MPKREQAMMTSDSLAAGATQVSPLHIAAVLPTKAIYPMIILPENGVLLSIDNSIQLENH